MSVLRGKSLGFQDEGGERVEKILVGDVVAAVNEVEAAERNGSPGAVDVIEEEFLCQNLGILVTFDKGCGRELPSCSQQIRYGGDGKGLEKGELNHPSSKTTFFKLNWFSIGKQHFTDY